MSVQDKIQLLKSTLLVVLKVAEVIARALESILETVKNGGQN